jgi:acetyl-CoA carboxylase carboxyl transferase subunit alpha
METDGSAQQELEKIEKQLAQLSAVAGENPAARHDLQILQAQVEALRAQVAQSHSAWTRTELARHPQRPYTLDFVQHLCTGFSELHGDRRYGEDPAIVCGMARFRDEEIMVVGHQKGRDTKQKLARNFGMPNPEGYRKAIRVMRIAEKFRRPIFCFVDTPGAFPGLGAEERGQAEAIAYNLREMARLEVPIIVTVTGEGGSGGALAIAIGNRVLMLENAIYSVISPEGCASIMWRDATKRLEAAQAMKITAPDLKQFGIIDDIVPEPPVGAHTDHAAAAALLSDALARHLADLRQLSPAELVEQRFQKFRNMTQFFDEVPA